MKVIKENKRLKITLIEKAGKKFIEKRIYDDKWELYKTLEKIKHPNIPAIINVELEEDTVVTEEFVEGKTLTTLMEEKYVFTEKQICSILSQLVAALSALHDFNIIHRDIKPDNIIMDEMGHIWLIDYDIARIYRKEIRKDTEQLGTFGYAPVEQYGMMPTGFKTDIYSLGMTLTTLLEYSGINGRLGRIAKKCTRLDPSMRYKNTKSLKRAISMKIMPLVLGFTTLSVLTAVVFYVYLRDFSDESTFVDFDEYEKYTEFKDYYTISHACIFSLDEPWEHILLIDDVSVKGKIKTGEKNTRIDADITLDNGVLSVKLNDKRGNKFKHDFEFENQYSYAKNYTDDLRKNADIICRDLDGDGVDEILIGLNEGSMGVSGSQFYNWFNYCIGWCVKYDENEGFSLCKGEMFSEGDSFTLNRYTNHITVRWEDSSDVMGYKLVDDVIEPL